MTKKQLEEKYGVRIVSEDYWHPLKGKFVKSYKMYSADGCSWEKGLGTIKACETECKEWEEHLLSIKKKVEEIRRKAV